MSVSLIQRDNCFFWFDRVGLVRFVRQTWFKRAAAAAERVREKPKQQKQPQMIPIASQIPIQKKNPKKKRIKTKRRYSKPAIKTSTGRRGSKIPSWGKRRAFVERKEAILRGSGDAAFLDVWRACRTTKAPGMGVRRWTNCDFSRAILRTLEQLSTGACTTVASAGASVGRDGRGEKGWEGRGACSRSANRCTLPRAWEWTSGLARWCVCVCGGWCVGG